MQTVDIQSQLEGLYKEVYADKLDSLIPDQAMLVSKISFSDSEKLGDVYVHPMVLTDQQGVTYAGPDEDAYTLEDAEAMNVKDAKLKGSQISIRGKIGYKAAASAVAKGKAAFVNATELVIKSLMRSLVKRVEVGLLYGGSGLGKVNASANIDATSTKVTFEAGSFASGIWVASNNAYIDFYDGATLVVGGVQVIKPDVKAKTLDVKASSGDITALDTAIAALGAGESLDIFYRGAKDKEALGLDQIIQTRGSLFGVDNTIFDLHAGQVVDNAGGQLNFDKLTEALVCAINYGLQDDVCVLVSPETLQDLNKDESALREYDSSYKSSVGEKGFDSIVYNHAGIKMEIKQHTCVKEGDAFIVPMKHLKRIGAAKESFTIPGLNTRAFRLLENSNAFELRAYTDQALFVAHVAHCVKINNIVNS